MMVGGLVLAGTAYLFVKIPKGFIPDQDTDQLSVITEAAQGTSFYQMSDYQKEVAKIVQANPNVAALMSTVGGTGAATLGGPNFGELVVRLKPRSQRTKLVNEIIDDLRPQLAEVPGIEGLSPEPAHHPHWRPGVQELVPDLPGLAQQEGALRFLGKARRSTEECRWPGRLDQRFGRLQSADRRRYRSR